MGECDQLQPTPADWSPIVAAPAQSAFIAVLAGFVFAGIIYILTDQRRRHSGSTLVLFMASFLCLAGASYMTTLISGETPCLRGWSESMFVSGLMAVGIVTMLCGVVWLLPAFYGNDLRTRWFMLACVFFVSLVAVELLTTTTRGYILDQPMDHGWREIANNYYITMIALVLAFALRGFPRHSGPRLLDKQQSRVTFAAAAILTYFLVSLAILGTIGDQPADHWDPPAPWIIYASILIPNIGAAFALIVTVWALPTKETWRAMDADDANRVKPGIEDANLSLFKG